MSEQPSKSQISQTPAEVGGALALHNQLETQAVVEQFNTLFYENACDSAGVSPDQAAWTPADADKVATALEHQTEALFAATGHSSLPEDGTLAAGVLRGAGDAAAMRARVRERLDRDDPRYDTALELVGLARSIGLSALTSTIEVSVEEEPAGPPIASLSAKEREEREEEPVTSTSAGAKPWHTSVSVYADGSVRIAGRLVQREYRENLVLTNGGFHLTEEGKLFIWGYGPEDDKKLPPRGYEMSQTGNVGSVHPDNVLGMLTSRSDEQAPMHVESRRLPQQPTTREQALEARVEKLERVQTKAQTLALPSEERAVAAPSVRRSYASDLPYPVKPEDLVDRIKGWAARTSRGYRALMGAPLDPKSPYEPDFWSDVGDNWRREVQNVRRLLGIDAPPGSQKGWATRKEKQRYIVGDAHPGSLAWKDRVALGIDDHGDHVAGPPGHSVTVFATTEGGKTEGVLKRAAAEHMGPVVCFSTTDDLLETLAVRQAMGPVHIFMTERWPEGSELDKLYGEYVSTFSPIALMTTFDNAQRISRFIREAGSGPANESKSDRGYWDGLGERANAAIGRAVNRRGGTPADMVAILNELAIPDETQTEADKHPMPAGLEEIRLELQAAIMGSDDPEVQQDVERARSSLRALGNNADSKLLQSIVSSAREQFRAFDNAGVMKATGSSEIIPSEIIDQNGTVYVIARSRDAAQFGPVYASLQEELIRAVTDRNWGSVGVDKRLRMITDEASKGPPFPNKDDDVTDGRHQGIQFVDAYQSPAQMIKKYGKEKTQTILDNTIVVALQGMNADTRQQLIREVGKYQTDRRQVSNERESYFEKALRLFGRRRDIQRPPGTRVKTDKDVMEDRVRDDQFPREIGKALIFPSGGGYPFQTRFDRFKDSVHNSRLTRVVQARRTKAAFYDSLPDPAEYHRKTTEARRARELERTQQPALEQTVPNQELSDVGQRLALEDEPADAPRDQPVLEASTPLAAAWTNYAPENQPQPEPVARSEPVDAPVSDAKAQSAARDDFDEDADDSDD